MVSRLEPDTHDRPSQDQHPRPSLIASLIHHCASQPGITILLVLLFSLWGWRCFIQAPLDAIPDLSDTQVIIYTEWPGRSPDLVENQITYPLTSALLSVPKVKYVRGQSFLGSSFVSLLSHNPAIKKARISAS